MPISISHYLNNMSKLTDQWNEYNYKDLNRQRIYLKDIDCPEVWHNKLMEKIPPGVFYLNESTGEPGGLGSVDEPNPSGPGTRKGKGVARAGDLMSCLPPAMRADNLMCYIGHEGTYTPAHREMCASLGQNIMVEASGITDEHGKPCKPGSSIWFMTETKERHLVSEYWLSTLGHDIEVESHFAQINAWKAAPFKTYVVEQKVGDFLLIPPLAPHQVWNRGTRTMKVAWNRTTVETLEMALNEALPRARMVCRDEQYKNKAIVMFALERYSNLLNLVDVQQKQTGLEFRDELNSTNSAKIRQLQKDFRRLFSLYSEILLSEMLPPVAATEKRGQYLPYDSNVTCSYCRCNIFNRFLTCTSCIIPLENGEEDTYDICMECYVMGRSCKCISRCKWVEQFPWQDLVQKHERWRLQVIGFDGHRVTEKSPQSLQVQRQNRTKKTLAQVCYEQLKARPWCNPEKKQETSLEKKLLLEEDRVNKDGTRKLRKRKRQSEKFLRGAAKCHISQHYEPRWKVAVCECGRGYHYGTLFRAFDVMPLTVMEDSSWKCPYCLKICPCPKCRKLPDWHPFEPNGTILGHDTKKIADPRSVESLVDFSHSNIIWINKAGDNDLYETRRLRRRKDEAALDKSTDAALDDHYVDEVEFTPVTSHFPDNGIKYNMDIDLPIDPMLRMEQVPAPQGGLMNGEVDESGQTTQRPEHTSTTAEYQNNYLKDSQTKPDNAHPIGFTAPAAVMVHPEPETNIAQDNNRMIYQYPDPTLPQFSPVPRSNICHPPLQAAQYDGQQDTVRQRRHEAQDIIRSDLVPSSKNDANEQYHHAQRRRTLEEAKRNDRFISAEAAITGKSLRLILPIDRTKLAAFSAKVSKAPQPRPSLEGDNIGDGNMVIVQSDVPPVPPPAPRQSNRATKKRKVREVRAVEDDDLSTRKKPGRKSVTTRMDVASDVRKSVNYAEISSKPDEKLHSGKRAIAEKLRKPRKLPTYLSLRNSGASPGGKDSPTGFPPKDLHHAREDFPASKKRKVKHPKAPVEEAPLPASNSLVPIDNFPAETLPEPDATVDLSMLGAGEITVCVSEAAKQAEENRKAKLKALHWADAETDVPDSSTVVSTTTTCDSSILRRSGRSRKPSRRGSSEVD